MKSHALYHYYNADDSLLYVGITSNPASRFSDHRRGAAWWYLVANIRVAHYPNRPALKQAERQAIRAERPLFNVAWADPECREELKEIAEEILDEAESEMFMDEMFTAVAATGITDDINRAIAEHRQIKPATA